MALAKWLSEKDVTASKLALEIGVTRQAVSSWVRGDCLPSAQNLAAIENYTNGAVTARSFFMEASRAK